MTDHSPFLERVLERLPKEPPTDYRFESWSVSGRPTNEGFGLLPRSGVDPDKLIEAAMDVDNYVGRVDHVSECRAIPDDRFSDSDTVRFYQRIQIPILGAIHHELVMRDVGTIEGYRVCFWEMLDRETEALNKKKGIRSQYSEGAWLARPGVVGYALSSAPRRSDVGFLKWKALTKGADVGASGVVRKNIECMSRWAASR